MVATVGNFGAKRLAWARPKDNTGHGRIISGLQDLENVLMSIERYTVLWAWPIHTVVALAKFDSCFFSVELSVRVG